MPPARGAAGRAGCGRVGRPPASSPPTPPASAPPAPPNVLGRRPGRPAPSAPSDAAPACGRRHTPAIRASHVAPAPGCSVVTPGRGSWTADGVPRNPLVHKWPEIRRGGRQKPRSGFGVRRQDGTQCTGARQPGGGMAKPGHVRLTVHTRHARHRRRTGCGTAWRGGGGGGSQARGLPGSCAGRRGRRAVPPRRSGAKRRGPAAALSPPAASRRRWRRSARGARPRWAGSPARRGGRG